MTQLGVAVRRKSLYTTTSVPLWRRFELVVIRNSLSPYFVWADHNNPQTEIVRGQLKRIQGLGLSSHIHGTLPMRRQYLPWWLGGAVTYNPLTKRHVPKREQLYPKDTQTRLKDYERVIRHNAALGRDLGIDVDVVSQLFDQHGSYRRYGIALMRDAFLWASKEQGEGCRHYLNECLGVSQPRWDAILGRIANNPRIHGLSLQVHHPIGAGLQEQLSLCEYVCQRIKRMGLLLNFGEMQFWLPHDVEETAASEEAWSHWHRSFWELAVKYNAKSYVVWGLYDDGTARLPLGGHGQSAFNFNREPKPFVKEILNA